MTGPHVAKVAFRACKNCLISVPQLWLPHQSTNALLVYELHYNGNQTAYFSWSGEVTSTKQSVGGECTIEVNGFYALKLGMFEGEEVLVTRKSGSIVSLEKLQAEPLAADDWEILELHTSYVQSNLMNQVRVVWNGQLLPIWVTQSICIFIKISNLEPDCAFGSLDQLTEVHVIPKSRDTPSITNQMQNSDTNISGKFFSANAHNERQLVHAVDVSGHDQLSTLRSSESEKWKISHIFEGIYNWFGDGATKKIIKNTDDDQGNGEPRVSFEEFRIGTMQIPSVELRVHPIDEDSMDDFIDDPLLQNNIIRMLLKQPTTVITLSQNFPNSDELILSRIPFVIGTLEKLIPTYEKSDKSDNSSAANTKDAKQPKRESYSKKHSPKNSTAISEKVTTRKFFVKVVFLDILRECLKQRSAPELSLVLKLRKYMVAGTVLMHDLIRSQMSCETTSKVRMTFTVTEIPQPTMIHLYPLQKTMDTLSKDEIQKDVNQWLHYTAAFSCPLIVTDGTVVQMPSHTGSILYFIIKAQEKRHSKADGQTVKPFLICSSLNIDIKFDVIVRDAAYHENTSSSTVPIIGMKSTSLGGFKEYVCRGISCLKVLLKLGPISRKLWQSNCPSSSGGGMLICGPQGCGKTTLAQTLARELYDEPQYRVFTHLISCKRLIGKRVESIIKIWRRAYQEAQYRSPSILILDDLDALAGSPSGPENESGGAAIYQARCAEALCDLMKWILASEKSRVATIATCKSVTSLHAKLSSPQGMLHLFQDTITINVPNANQREHILKSLIVAKPMLDADSISVIQWHLLAPKMEGFVAHDLDTVIDRAAHVATARLGVNGALMLHNEDIERALVNYEPLALRGVHLHKPGTKGWNDVGGLSQVKQALIQTLQWPIKYPELFAKCPLPMRSGILLYGPPGTGKTLLAGVVAKECGMNFVSIKGPELLSKYIGASEQAVRDLFEKASDARPCIIFFDEFDSLAPRRGHDSTGVTDRVVNQLLTQMDGVEDRRGVYILAATSRPDLIDPALLRPGRLDKSLYCPMPTAEERREILICLSGPMTLSDNTDLDVIADVCVDFSGADLQGLLYNAQLNAIHRIYEQSSEKEVEEEETLPNKEPSSPKDIHSDDDFEHYPESPRPEMARSQSSCCMEMVHLPNLVDGPNVPIHDATRQALEEQIDTIYCNIHGCESVRREDAGLSSRRLTVLVTQEDIMAAAHDMQPSVGPADRKRYQAIYEAFVKSKGGHFETEAPIGISGKRVTLA